MESAWMRSSSIYGAGSAEPIQQERLKDGSRTDPEAQFVDRQEHGGARTEMNENVFPYACDMTALDPSTRKRHGTVTRVVFQAVEYVEELLDGYAFQLPRNTGVLSKTVEFVENESRCCPFFRFGIEVEPEDGPIWLRLTGPEGVQSFIAAEIGGALREEVARKANLI